MPPRLDLYNTEPKLEQKPLQKLRLVETLVESKKVRMNLKKPLSRMKVVHHASGTNIVLFVRMAVM